MTGDFMAMLLHQGFVEFRFDCGSGVGVVRSEETVLLNQWNHITLYRHRWDAWLQLNNGKHVQGRSKGLFSRITFREPLFIGGPGNTTGLAEKLPVVEGLKGCIRHLEVNDHPYKFALEPKGEATKGYGIEECTADRCSRVPCQHGGKCLTSDSSAVCLCPLGFSGDLCEIRVDLQVPSFNGSSHLRYRGLGDSALTWLELSVALKPTAPDGLVAYNGRRADGSGDFMALYLREGHVEFAYDLGTGSAAATSRRRVQMGEWHQIKVSRTGRLAVLIVDDQPMVEALSPGAFTQLSLPLNMYLGGVPNWSSVSPQVAVRSAFVGCIQKVAVNGHQMPVLAEALGGANVDNCPHPCVARPCGEDGECIPQMDYFTCRCKPGYRDHLCARRPPAPSFPGTPGGFLRLADHRTLAALDARPLVLNVRFRLATKKSHKFGSSTDGLLAAAITGRQITTLGLENGGLVLRFSACDEESSNIEEIRVVHNGTVVSDGLWHRAKAVRDGTSGLLIVDDGPAITRQSVQLRRPRSPPALTTSSEQDGLYVGGMPPSLLAARTPYVTGIRGCVADLVLNQDHRIRLEEAERGGDEMEEVGECDAA
ncbi:unnamed protein product [Acanthoscelides obtectus]|uniref:Pikachurin n=1 Tax=Acanthoscelides obtectus TaxID=200917 RepID=A0A9P0Q8M9_ACAOB|nr:unnamed protein product [Acanthoscelides obtectus]CAK1675718.1 Pikachurin [Acanthoscelides obtectus]